jgi:8-oxo-dGTP pyrophosphatase MutT (NUDIX family)
MFTGNKKIRVKTICLFCDDNDIFVSKAYDSVKKDFYFRPIGGTNEFGEYSEDTLKREISEELGTTIKNIKLETVCENIFTCDGLDGHEIVFIYSAEFVDEKYYERKIFEIKEDNGEIFEACWINEEEFGSRKLRLVPEKLNTYLNIL